MHIPIEDYLLLEKCTFLQRNVPVEGHIAGHCRTLLEGFRAQESRALAYFRKWHAKEREEESACWESDVFKQDSACWQERARPKCRCTHESQQNHTILAGIITK